VYGVIVEIDSFVALLLYDMLGNLGEVVTDKIDASVETA